MHFDKLVVGGTLEAFLYAHRKALPIIYTHPEPPFVYDYASNDLDFSFLNLRGERSLNSPQGKISVGLPLEQVWQKLIFLLSLAGQCIYGDSVQSLTIQDNEVYINCKLTKRKRASFNKLIIFDDTNISGLPEIIGQKRDKYVVYDWVNVVSGGLHEYDIIRYESDFVKKIYCYPSYRNTNTKLKDLVCMSYLSEEELNDFSFSSTYVKFRLLEVFKSLDIRGARNGRDVTNPEKYKYYAVKMEPSLRVVKAVEQNFYKQDARFVFIRPSIEEILSMPLESNPALKRLLEKI